MRKTPISRIREKTICFLLIILAALFLSACSGDETETDRENIIVLGFSQLGDESEWRTASTNDIKRAAMTAGIQLLFDNAQQQQFNQIKAIRSFILRGVDIIAFCPIVEEGWDDYLNQLNRMGLDELMKIYKDAYELYKNIR